MHTISPTQTASPLEWCCRDGSTIPLLPVVYWKSEQSFNSILNNRSSVDSSWPLHAFLQHRNCLVGELHRCVLASGVDAIEGNCLCTLENINSSLMELSDHEKQEVKRFVLTPGSKKAVRRNLFSLAKQCRTILEVGFNAGHSAALFLFGGDVASQERNSDCKGRDSVESRGRSYCAFDICQHSYTSSCFEALQKEYDGEVDMELIAGDSRDTLPAYRHARSCKKFDLIHIDGGHSVRLAQADIMNCFHFAGPETFLVVDDAKMKGVKKVLEGFITSDLLIEVDYDSLGLSHSSAQRIFRYRC